MESQDQNQITTHSRGKRIGAGMLLLLIGSIILLQQLGVIFLPLWLFTWPMILILLGLFSGIKHGFRGVGWIILLLVGGIFLYNVVNPTANLSRFILPAIVMGIGLVLIFRRRNPMRDHFRNHCRRRMWEQWEQRRQYRQGNIPPGGVSASGFAADASDDTDDYLDTVSIFAGVRKSVMSKNFKGGEVTAVMGGAEIDLSQADISGTVVLEVTAVLGGAKLIVPANWEVKSQPTAILGGIDDKRQVQPGTADPNKVLLLKGAAVLGGIEIRNF